MSVGERVNSQVAGYGYSYAITSLLSALLVVLKESSAPVMDMMARLSGHHWVTHGILDIILFVAIGWLLSRSALASDASYGSVISAVIGSTVISGLIIAGFYAI
ncbi:MAG: hypothetical protein APF80_06460 [Alphaproteobacteria bacterium BRH_c36]|nr:MAG: hypothetical protein APF80_06460 [Alphaproteobacteria bacterium BRH_c36]